MSNDNETFQSFPDVPPHMLEAIHGFLFGLHMTHQNPHEAHLRPGLRTILPLVLAVYGLLIVVGISANLFQCAFVARHRLHRDPTVAFLLNNALADIIKCACVVPLTLHVTLLQNWTLGELLCSFLPMLQDIPLHVTTLTFVLIAWDRYRLVRNPRKARVPALVCAVGTWLTALCLVLPYPIYIFYVDLGKYIPSYKNVGICMVNLTEDMHEYSKGIFILMFVAPMVLISYLHIKISRELHSNSAIILYEATHRSRNRSRTDSHSTCMDIRDNHGDGDAVSQCSRYSNNHRDSRASSVFGPPSRMPSHHLNQHHTQPPKHQQSSTQSGNPLHRKSSVQQNETVGQQPRRSGGGYYRSSLGGGGGGAGGAGGSVGDRSNELDMIKERRTQKYMVAMVTVYAVCLCPLMVQRLARLAFEETYENQQHIDLTYIVLVWFGFLPTCTGPILFIYWQTSRPTRERLRGYFRFSNRKFRHHSCETVGTIASGVAPILDEEDPHQYADENECDAGRAGNVAGGGNHEMVTVTATVTAAGAATSLISSPVFAPPLNNFGIAATGKSSRNNSIKGGGSVSFVPLKRRDSEISSTMSSSIGGRNTSISLASVSTTGTGTGRQLPATPIMPGTTPSCSTLTNNPDGVLYPHTFVIQHVNTKATQQPVGGPYLADTMSSGYGQPAGSGSGSASTTNGSGSAIGHLL